MKFYTVLIVFLLTIAHANAQEYKVAKTTGKLTIVEVNDVRIEGYDGKEIVFTSRNHKDDRDERASGLRAISSMGLEDNTGIGLAVQTNGDVIEVRQLKKMDGPEILIKVPKGIVISYEHSSPYGDEFRLKNLENEVQISTVHNQVMLENVTGVVTVKTVHGDIDATFPAIKNKISLESVHGHVDIALPADTKANLKMSTSWGELFVDPGFKIEMEKKDGLQNYSDKFNGKLNGGGLEIELASTHNNVYLRKK
jgi:predicted membrane protein